jgi:dipicolinate synthase subunit A
MLFAGSITEEILKLAKENNVKIVDLMKQEELVILNTIATAEGAIEVALRETNINIHGSNVLILGFGRVGKTTAMKFSALSANVTCSARKEKDFAWIETLGFKSVNTNNLKENLNKYEIIINTIPTMILSKEELKYVNKDCLIIDLASKPGGVDFDEAKRLGINARLELALPGKVSPKTSAKYIKTAIENIRKNKEE